MPPCCVSRDSPMQQLHDWSVLWKNLQTKWHQAGLSPKLCSRTASVRSLFCWVRGSGFGRAPRGRGCPQVRAGSSCWRRMLGNSPSLLVWANNHQPSSGQRETPQPRGPQNLEAWTFQPHFSWTFCLLSILSYLPNERPVHSCCAFRAAMNFEMYKNDRILTKALIFLFIFMHFIN